VRVLGSSSMNTGREICPGGGCVVAILSVVVVRLVVDRGDGNSLSVRSHGYWDAGGFDGLVSVLSQGLDRSECAGSSSET
jgi:hypothetical protein